MDLLATIVVDGLIYAGWLFIVSLGLTLVFGVLNILNIAHGSLYAIGAYASASLVGAYFAVGGDAFPYGSYAALILAAVLVAVVLGPLLERGLLRYFYGRDEVLNVLVTYAVFLILEDVMKLIWGVNPYFVYEPYTLLGDVEIGPLFYVGYDFAVIAAAIVVGLAVWLTLNRTQIGKVVLAVIHDAEMSQTMGVNVQRIYLGAFTAGAFLAGHTGAWCECHHRRFCRGDHWRARFGTRCRNRSAHGGDQPRGFSSPAAGSRAFHSIFCHGDRADVQTRRPIR